MKRKFLYGVFFILVFLVLSGGVMFLWNSLLPKIVRASVINYWQALGLMVLSRILFGSFHFKGIWGGTYDNGPKDYLKNKLMNMDEADRKTFKEEWRKRCENRKM